MPKTAQVAKVRNIPLTSDFNEHWCQVGSGASNSSTSKASTPQPNAQEQGRESFKSSNVEKDGALSNGHRTIHSTTLAAHGVDRPSPAPVIDRTVATKLALER